MSLSLRKFSIGMFSLVVIVAVFIAYNRYAMTPQILVEPAAPNLPRTEDFDREIGDIDGVSIGRAKNALYSEYAEEKLTSEFGFETLLHETGNEWVIEKPFRNIYRSNVNCFITADQGSVAVEGSRSSPNPKDATLTGNVKIQILPTADSDLPECTLYLDDIDFISDRSLFRTDGPVKLVSEQAVMTGTGLQIVYDEQTEQLRYLKIVDLEKVSIRTASKGSLFSSEKPEQKQAGQQAQSEQQTPAQTLSPGETVYKCYLSQDVVIRTPEQLILADQIFINNIIFSSGKKDDSEKTSKTASVDANSETTQAAPSEVADANDFIDILITCEKGLLIVPSDSKVRPEEVTPGKRLGFQQDTYSERIIFATERINYDAVTETIHAEGTSNLRFYADDFVAGPNSKPSDPLPVEVKCNKVASFIPSENQIVFDGETLTKMVRSDVGFQSEYTLTADKLAIDLSRYKNSNADVDRIKATSSGEKDVRLAIAKRDDSGDIIGFTKLEAPQIDYFPDLEMFWAIGKGLIAVNNSNIAETGADPNRLSLTKPCWVILEDFSRLEYSLASGEIDFTAYDENPLTINYIPVGSNTDSQVQATAGKLQATLFASDGGRSELCSVLGSGGVSYNETPTDAQAKTEPIDFIGQSFYYDKFSSMIKAQGSDLFPCLLNGVLVDALEYDLQTGQARKAKGKITAPGVISR